VSSLTAFPVYGSIFDSKYDYQPLNIVISYPLWGMLKHLFWTLVKNDDKTYLAFIFPQDYLRIPFYLILIVLAEGGRDSKATTTDSTRKPSVQPF